FMILFPLKASPASAAPPPCAAPGGASPASAYPAKAAGTHPAGFSPPGTRHSALGTLPLSSRTSRDQPHAPDHTPHRHAQRHQARALKHQVHPVGPQPKLPAAPRTAHRSPHDEGG